MVFRPSPIAARKGKGEIKGERRQLEAGQTPEQYQKTLQTEKQYQDEQLRFILDNWGELSEDARRRIYSIIVEGKEYGGG